jgi:hypothetical protein
MMLSTVSSKAGAADCAANWCAQNETRSIVAAKVRKLFLLVLIMVIRFPEQLVNLDCSKVISRDLRFLPAAKLWSRARAHLTRN